ncbi:HNH endonuclease-domain-containing protein [Aspergillus egyptiacus]|nr:HNH endonuclease-domain-containing protein [Aspergillus egyptiacus]
MSNPFQAPVTFLPRNVHIFASNGDYLGGAWLNTPPHISNDEFYNMCEHFIRFPSNHRWRLHRLGRHNQFQAAVPRDNSAIEQGRYVVLGNQSQPIQVTLTPERAVRRVPTHQPPTSRLRSNQRHFRDAVFARDSRCVITGAQGPRHHPTRGLISAHIFPVSRRSQRVDQGFEAWITDQTPAELIGPNRLFSAQNGLMLSADIHAWFDAFDLGINPDRGYRTVVFAEDTRNFGGIVLSSSTRACDPNVRVSDNCLRWHYHQCILTHMRGAGEPPWDLYDDEYDDMNAMMEQEEAAELLELEFGNRLGPYIDDDHARSP